MKFLLFSVWTVILFSESCRSEGIKHHNEACQSWREIESLIDGKINLSDMKCILNSDCTGLNCSGKYQQFEFSVDVKIDPCKNPLSLEATISIPYLGINREQYSLHDGKYNELPDSIHGFSLMKYAEISMKQQGQNVTMSISLIHLFGQSLSLISNRTIVMPECKTGISLPSTSKSESTFQQVMDPATNITIQNTSRPCDMSQIPNGCRKHEFCLQTNNSSMKGFCFCMKTFHLDHDNCIADSVDPVKPDSSSVILPLAVAVPILFIIACAIIALLVVKLDLVDRFRDYRRGIRSYTTVEIGNDDDEPLVT